MKLQGIQQRSPAKGFGCQSSRFQSSSTEIPGPSYYYDESKSSLERMSPSLSRKGYSNGFLSGDHNREEFLGLLNGLPGICPGLYQLPRAMDYTQRTTNRKGGSLPFLLGPCLKTSSTIHRSRSPEAGEERKGKLRSEREIVTRTKEENQFFGEFNKFVLCHHTS